MTNQLPNSEIRAAERAEIFHDQYGNDPDAAAALPDFVIAAGNYISRIVGPDDADAGMAQIVSRVVGDKISPASEWRAALTEASANCFSEWRIGPELHDLAAYAYYGIVLHDSEDAAELALHIEHLLTQAQELVAETPFEQWRLPASNDLTRLVFLARNRWALDNGEPIEPAALAQFGGVSDGRMRNMMSGANRTFSSKDGKVPAPEAVQWLAGRPEFWNSIWREQSLPQYAHKPSAPLHQAVFVPVARDGTTFHPSLQRGSGYTIGKKGTEEQVADFNEALAQLQRMPIPYWRRPNSSGSWGIVAGIRWERFDMSDLRMPADNTGRDLATDGQA